MFDFSFLDSPELWKSIAFVAVVFLTFMPICRLLLTKLDAQIKETSFIVSEAEKLKKEAENKLVESQKKYDARESERKKQILSAKNQALEICKNYQKELSERLERRQRSVLIREKNIKQDALKSLKQDVLSVAMRSIANIFKSNKKISEDKSFFNKSLLELEHALSNQKDVNKIIK